MQQVDHYLRQAKSARQLAANSPSEWGRTHFTQIAEAWENLAEERLSYLRIRAEKAGANALLIVTQPAPADDQDIPSP